MNLFSTAISGGAHSNKAPTTYTKNNKRIRTKSEKGRKKNTHEHQRFPLNGKLLLSRNLHLHRSLAIRMRRNVQRVCKVYHQRETINIKKREVVTIPKKREKNTERRRCVVGFFLSPLMIYKLCLGKPAVSIKQ